MFEADALSHELVVRAIFGPFGPDSDARRIRQEHEAKGLHTCWRAECLRPFRPRRVIGTDGRVHQLGRGRLYCSRRCWAIDRTRWIRDEVAVDAEADDVLVLDLRRCRRCPS